MWIPVIIVGILVGIASVKEKKAREKRAKAYIPIRSDK